MSRNATSQSPSPYSSLAEDGERHLRDFLKHANYLIQSTTLEGRLLFVNETWKRVLGYDDTDLAATLSLFDLLAPERRAADEATLRHAIAEPGTHAIELLLVAKDGSRVLVAGESDCRFVDGVAVASRAIFRDVSAQRIAEQQARQLEMRHAAVVSVLSEGIAILGADGTIELVNESAERILGLRAVDVVGRRLLDWEWRIIDEDGGELPREAHPALVALHTGREQADTVIGVRRGDTGARVWLAVNARPLVRPGERQAHLAVASFRDVTEQIAAQAALREREARFRGFLETVRAVAVCLDTTGAITFANDYLLELTGWERAEVMGTNWFETFAPPGARVGVAGDVPAHHDHELLTRGGEVRAILWDSTPLRDDGGTVVGSARIGHDITERRRIERLKEELIATASHELRTPLTSIRGALDLLQASSEARTDREQSLLDMAARNAERLNRLVNDLLDIERMQSGTELLRCSSVDVDDLIAGALDTVRSAAEAGGVQLRVDQQQAPMHAWVDADRIAQVLVNLLGNAIKFSPAEGVVTVEASAVGAELRLLVRDGGVGVPAEKLESIFEPFVQVHESDARARRGAGLGLAISRAIVIQHGGRIWAESAGEGRGTIVTVALPGAHVEAGASTER